MKKKVVLFFTLALMFLACAEDVIIEETYTLKFGSECGWCAGQEYLTITNSKIEYVRNIPCGDDKGVLNKSRELTTGEWDALNNSFDYELFLTLDYSNCNVCADGCDEIIEITDEASTHELRYSFEDEVEGMQTLRQKLSKIMEEMRDS